MEITIEEIQGQTLEETVSTEIEKINCLNGEEEYLMRKELGYEYLQN